MIITISWSHRIYTVNAVNVYSFVHMLISFLKFEQLADLHEVKYIHSSGK
jgi:hypothetical protein